MSLREQIMNDVKVAMRERDQVKLDSLRFLQAAVKNKEIELRPNPMTEEEVVGVIKKLVKQRKESIEQYTAAGRKDLADKESQELTYLEGYMPAQLGRPEIEKIVADAITKLGAKSVKEMGAVMKEVIAASGGRADGKIVSEVVKAKLS